MKIEDATKEIAAELAAKGGRFKADLKSERFEQLMDRLCEGKPGAINVLCFVGIRYGWVVLELIEDEGLKGAALWDAGKVGSTFVYELLCRHPLAIGAMLMEFTLDIPQDRGASSHPI